MSIRCNKRLSFNGEKKKKKKTGINITIEYKNLLITRRTEKFLWSNLQQPSQVNVTPAESGRVWP